MTTKQPSDIPASYIADVRKCLRNMGLDDVISDDAMPYLLHAFVNRYAPYEAALHVIDNLG